MNTQGLSWDTERKWDAITSATAEEARPACEPVSYVEEDFLDMLLGEGEDMSIDQICPVQQPPSSGPSDCQLPLLSGPSPYMYHPPPLPGARQTTGTQTEPCMPDVVTNQLQELSREVSNLQTLVVVEMVEMRRSLARLREDIRTQQQQRAREQRRNRWNWWHSVTFPRVTRTVTMIFSDCVNCVY